jgi:tetratricopeptide (TPR) repeat protein
LLGKAHVGIATVLIDLEKYDCAMDHLKAAEQLQFMNPSLQYDAEFMSDLYYLMGTIHAFRNSPSNANVYLAKAMKYSADALIHPIRAHSFNIFTRAAVLAMSEEYHEALSLTFSALHLFETIGYTEGAIHAHNNIAYINKLMGNTDKANEHFEIAVSLARKHPELVNEKLRNELAKEGYTV